MQSSTKVILSTLLVTNLVVAHPNNQDVFELSIEELLNTKVTTTSLSPKPLNKADGIITVINQQQLIDYGVNNLLEVVAMLPATQVIADASVPQDLITVRGDKPIASDHVLILLDGRPYRVSAFSTGSNRQMMYAFPVSLIKQVEFVQGPASVLYGANAYTAIINVITKQHESHDVSVNAQVGSFNETHFDVSGFFHLADFTGRLGIQSHSSDGWDTQFVDRQRELVDFNLLSESSSVFAKLENASWSFSYFESRTNSHYYGLKEPFERGRKFSNEGSALNISFAKTLVDIWNVEFSYAWNQYQTFAFKGDEFNFDFINRVSITDHINLILGVNSSQIVDAKSTSDEPTLQIEEFDTHNDHIYGQLDIDYDNTVFSFGIAKAFQDHSGSITLPKASIVHVVNNHWTAKLMYTEGYRAANAIETSLNIFNGLAIGNENLSPELVTTRDAQLVYQDNNTRFAFSLFDTQQTDLITVKTEFEPRFQISFINGQRRHFHGGTLEWRYQNKNWLIDTSYSYQENYRDKTATQIKVNNITELPRHLIKLGIRYKSDKWSAAIFDNFRSDYQDNGLYETTTLNVATKHEHNVTANVNYRPDALDQYQGVVRLKITNLLNQELTVKHFVETDNVGSYPYAPERAFHLGIIAKF